MAITYFQPVTRGEITEMFGREISRDLVASLRAPGSSPQGRAARSPAPPYAYVTTSGLLAQFGFDSLRGLPDNEKLEDAGLVDRVDRDKSIGQVQVGRAPPSQGQQASRSKPSSLAPAMSSDRLGEGSTCGGDDVQIIRVFHHPCSSRAYCWVSSGKRGH
jgi:hypothetical protein